MSTESLDVETPKQDIEVDERPKEKNLPTDFSEVGVTQILVRNGENRYLKVKRKYPLSSSNQTAHLSTPPILLQSMFNLTTKIHLSLYPFSIFLVNF